MTDALRSGRESAAPPAETLPAPTEPAEPRAPVVASLRAARIAGILVLAGRDCRVRALALPGLRPASPPAAGTDSVACALASLRDAGRCAPPADEDCVPRLRPDGSVAVVRDGGLWVRAAECARPLGRCWRELLSARELRRTGVVEPRLVDHLWLSPSRAAVLLSWPGGGYVLGLYEGRTLIALHRWGGEGPGRLVGPAARSLFGALPGRVFDGDGNPVPLASRFPNVRALAWSPDGRWAALALDEEIVLVPVEELSREARPRRVIRLPYAARDIAWRDG